MQLNEKQLLTVRILITKLTRLSMDIIHRHNIHFNITVNTHCVNIHAINESGMWEDSSVFGIWDDWHHDRNIVELKSLVIKLENILEKGVNNA